MCAGVVTVRKLCLEHDSADEAKAYCNRTEGQGASESFIMRDAGAQQAECTLNHKRASAQAQGTQRNTMSSIDKHNRAAAHPRKLSHHASHIPLSPASRDGSRRSSPCFVD